MAAGGQQYTGCQLELPSLTLGRSGPAALSSWRQSGAKQQLKNIASHLQN